MVVKKKVLARVNFLPNQTYVGREIQFGMGFRLRSQVKDMGYGFG